jgi:acyl-CoA reductase-like NAD-dependent aldehyde dehydrogenase
VTELGRKQLLIGGEWREAEGGATMPVVNPATEAVIAEVASASPADVDTACRPRRSLGTHAGT